MWSLNVKVDHSQQLKITYEKHLTQEGQRFLLLLSTRKYLLNPEISPLHCLVRMITNVWLSSLVTEIHLWISSHDTKLVLQQLAGSDVHSILIQLIYISVSFFHEIWNTTEQVTMWWKAKKLTIAQGYLEMGRYKIYIKKIYKCKSFHLGLG